MIVRYEVWNNHDILVDPTTRYPDAIYDYEDMWRALREFCEGSESKYLDLVVHDILLEQWHEITMKNKGWEMDFQQSASHNFTRERGHDV